MITSGNAIAAARAAGPRQGAPAILMPNPFYPAYAAGARAAGCEAVFLPTVRDNGFLPDLDALDAGGVIGFKAFLSNSGVDFERIDDDLLYAGLVAMRRLGEPEDIANVHAFLVSSDADFVSGVTIPVTGGQLGGM